jgi:hypothetical protein
MTMIFLQFLACLDFSGPGQEPYFSDASQILVYPTYFCVNIHKIHMSTFVWTKCFLYSLRLPPAIFGNSCGDLCILLVNDKV